MNILTCLLLPLVMEGPIVGILTALVFVAILILVFRIAHKQNHRNWDFFIRYAGAFRIKLEKPEIGYFMASLPQFVGDYGNVRLDIRLERRGSGKHTHYYTVLNIYLRGSGDFELKVVKQGLLQKIGKAFGMQDIITGNDEFDQKFILKSNNEDRARQLFDFQFSNEFLSVENMLRGRIRLKNNSIHYEEMVVIRSEQVLERMIAITHLCVKLAEKAGTHSGRVYSQV